MSDEIDCPSCLRRILPTSRYGASMCRYCGRLFQDTVNLTLEKGLNIGIRKWRFTDIKGKKHEVVALRWGDTILHFGEDGLYTDIFK